MIIKTYMNFWMDFVESNLILKEYLKILRLFLNEIKISFCKNIRRFRFLLAIHRKNFRCAIKLKTEDANTILKIFLYFSSNGHEAIVKDEPRTGNHCNALLKSERRV